MNSGSSRGCSPAICWTRAKHNLVWIILCEQSRSWPSIFRQILDFHTPGFTALPICFFTCFSRRVIFLQVLHNLRPTKNSQCILPNTNKTKLVQRTKQCQLCVDLCHAAHSSLQSNLKSCSDLDRFPSLMIWLAILWWTINTYQLFQIFAAGLHLLL